MHWCRSFVRFRFQSTLPVWGATLLTIAIISLVTGFQSTLPVWGATSLPTLSSGWISISIHAPRVGSDYYEALARGGSRYISIHAPRVGSDSRSGFCAFLTKISIHAPRVGSDCAAYRCGGCNKYFNPRSPCGERHIYAIVSAIGGIFQSTLPVWGATKIGVTASGNRLFQSTLPVWGATAKIHKFCCVSLAKK